MLHTSCFNSGFKKDYAAFFDFVGPCESWSSDILEGFAGQVNSDNVKTITKFAFEHGVPCHELVALLRDLPGERASEECVLYAGGLYHMLAASDSTEHHSDHQRDVPSPSLPQNPTSSASQFQGLQWSVELEDFAGSMRNWPADVLEALGNVLSEDSVKTIAEWGYFHSIPLDNLTDVLQGQEGATGDPALTLILC